LRRIGERTLGALQSVLEGSAELTPQELRLHQAEQAKDAGEIAQEIDDD
jgi:hypothetical protein